MKTLGYRKWIFRKRRFRIRIFFVCEHGIRIFSATVSKESNNGLPTATMNIASRACAVSLPKPVAAYFFLFRRELPSKTKRRMDSGHRKCGYCQKQLCIVVFPDEGRVFCFCLTLLRLSFITCLHSQTMYTHSSRHKHVTQKNDNGT